MGGKVCWRLAFPSAEGLGNPKVAAFYSSLLVRKVQVSRPPSLSLIADWVFFLVGMAASISPNKQNMAGRTLSARARVTAGKLPQGWAHCSTSATIAKRMYTNKPAIPGIWYL